MRKFKSESHAIFPGSASLVLAYRSVVGVQIGNAFIDP